ncbi:MAG: hypothetical protein IJW86_09695 [Clostridia bacterium]|nr:hypothetical protein [Clostridia bacterium]
MSKKETKSNFNVASDLEGLSYELERVEDLICVVVTEIFDKAVTGDKAFITLGPYEMRFSAILDAAINQLKQHQKTLFELASIFYQNAKKENTEQPSDIADMQG